MIHLKNFVLLAILWPLSLGKPSQKLRGYDCSSSLADHATYSTLDILPCVTPDLARENKTETLIAVYQQPSFKEIVAQGCRLRILQTVTRCGMHGHTSEVQGGHRIFHYPLTPDMCLMIHKTGQFSYPYKPSLTTSIKKGSVTEGFYYVVGSTDRNGDCYGGEFVVDGIDIPKALVSHSWELRISETKGKYSHDNDIIHFGDIRCKATDLTCYDHDIGVRVWELKDQAGCSVLPLEFLYEVMATKWQIRDLIRSLTETVITVKQNKYVFSIKDMGREVICSTVVQKTVQAGIYIQYRQPHTTYTLPHVKPPEEAPSLIPYINTKFLYLETNTASQLLKLHQDLSFQQCQNRRTSLLMLLSQAYTNPDEFAYNLLEKPGYTAVIGGETVHVLSCQVRELRIRETELCYEELPVLLGDESWFMKPRTRILTKVGHERPCHPTYLPSYLIGHTWLSVGTQAVRAAPPQVLDPNGKTNWTWEPTLQMGMAGLYSAETIKDWDAKIQFTHEKDAVVTILAGKVSGAISSTQGFDLTNLLPSDYFEKKASSYFSTMWHWMESFGQISSGFIGLIILCKLGWVCINIFIDTYHLYKVFGWSMKLLAGLCSGLVHWIVANDIRKKMDTNTEDGIEADIPLVKVKEDLVPPIIPETDKHPDITQSTHPYGYRVILTEPPREIAKKL